MALKHFVVDLSLLGPGMTGVKLYALSLARRLERSFVCRVISPRHLGPQFAQPLECEEPIALRNSILTRGRITGETKALVRSSDTFIYCPYMHGFLRHRNQVITIHDLIAHRFPTRNPIERVFDGYFLPALAARVSGVFTVSLSSRAEIASYYDLPLERIHIVPNGLDLAQWCPGAPSSPTPDPYLLVVSANRPYKNTTELLRHHRLWSREYRLKIVSTRARYGGVIRAAVREYALGDRVEFVDNVSEEELIGLYRGCAAVVYPSLMEGFGRPALEAMAVGRPVILSDIAVHQESFRDAAIFVTPGNSRTWEEAFEQLTDAASLQPRIERGLAIARRYSLDNSYHCLTRALLKVRPELEQLRRRDTQDDTPPT